MTLTARHDSLEQPLPFFARLITDGMSVKPYALTCPKQTRFARCNNLYLHHRSQDQYSLHEFDLSPTRNGLQAPECRVLHEFSVH